MKPQTHTEAHGREKTHGDHQRRVETHSDAHTIEQTKIQAKMDICRFIQGETGTQTHTNLANVYSHAGTLGDAQKCKQKHKHNETMNAHSETHSHVRGSQSYTDRQTRTSAHEYRQTCPSTVEYRRARTGMHRHPG
eukprot:6056834-Pleurochrysis_carterae.AAC.1